MKRPRIGPALAALFTEEQAKLIESLRVPDDASAEFFCAVVGIHFEKCDESEAAMSEGERQPIVTADSMEVRQPPNVSRLPGAQAVEGRAENPSGPLAKCVDIDAAMKERHLRMHGGMMFGDENDAASGDERHDATPGAQAATSPQDSGNVCQEHAARCTDCGAPAVGKDET